MKNRITRAFLGFIVAVGLLWAFSPAAQANSYSKSAEAKELQDKASAKYDAYQRFSLAEEEARQEGRDQDAEIFRKEKVRALFEYRHLEAEALARKAAAIGQKHAEEEIDRN